MNCRWFSWVAITAAAVAAALSRAQAPERPTIVLETYFVSNESPRGAAHRLSWFEVRAPLARNLEVVHSQIQLPANHLDDEGYIAYWHAGNRLRFGRFRQTFGFGDWSELFYTPFISFPMIRMLPVDRGHSLIRASVGADLSLLLGEHELQVGLIESPVPDQQFVHSDPNLLIVRLQKPVGSLILGINALRPLDDGPAAHGLDVRWSTAQWQVRGELVQGATAPHVGSHYLDVTYRPPGQTRLKLGVRTEAYGRRGQPTARLDTLALRYVVSPHVTLSLNRASGNGVGAAGGMSGWSFQTMFMVTY